MLVSGLLHSRATHRYTRVSARPCVRSTVSVTACSTRSSPMRPVAQAAMKRLGRSCDARLPKGRQDPLRLVPRFFLYESPKLIKFDGLELEILRENGWYSPHLPRFSSLTHT